ncbi:MAG: glutaredoxin 3 [Rickettsiales bacterium]|nr:MAG: glutaredoxin 3 [Rickettsiales bacterium]
MKKFTIYTTNVCPYCVRAKALFDRKGFAYDELNAEDAKIREEMLAKSGGMRTVPQIFLGHIHIGGCDELYALEKDGKLDGMVEG